jgi:hypothetical protein
MYKRITEPANPGVGVLMPLNKMFPWQLLTKL